MRRNLDKPEISWSFRIPREDREALGTLLPMKGAQTWLLQRGLCAFLDLIEQPSRAGLRLWAHNAIQQALYIDETPGDLVDLSVRIPTELYVRFSRLFPEFGAATWFTRTYLRQIISDLRASGVSLEDQVELAVSRLGQETE